MKKQRRNAKPKTIFDELLAHAPPEAAESLRALAYLKGDDEAYTRDVRSTALGQRSFDIRARAVALKEQGKLAASHEQFLLAARLHSDDDTSAAAAAAWHDLAQSLMDQNTRLPEERYRQAELLLRRSANSARRRKYPIRLAMTLTMLASSLRYQAVAFADNEHRDEVLDEAERFSLHAVELMVRLGHPGLPSRINYLFNLGNLREQREHWDAAIDAYEQVLELQRQLGMGHDDLEHRTSGSARVSLARLLFRRAREGEQERSLRLLAEVIEHEKEEADEARLWRAEFLAEDAARLDEARQLLGRIKPERLKPDRRPLLAQLSRRLDATPDRALKLFRSLVQDAMKRRKTEATDLNADHAAREAQDAAGAAARILSGQGLAVAAFIELENVSGLRYLEALHSFHFRPADPVSNELWKHRLKLSTQASLLSTMVGDLRLLTEAQQRQGLQEMAAAFANKHAEDGHFGERAIGDPWFLGALRGAITEPYPVERLQALAEDRIEETYRVIGLLLERLPPDEQRSLFGTDYLDEPGLERLLTEHPDTVLVRLHLEEDLLAVAVWIERGRLVSRSLRVSLPEWGWTLVSQASRAPERVSPQKWNALLSALDISAVFPSHPMRRIILLPSFRAAFFPLAALGPTGRRPLELFASVIWLPSLAPLMERQVAHAPREGVLTVLPGNTRFHSLATHTRLPGERRLRGAEAIPETVAEQARAADIICFFAHGAHTAPEEPHLLLEGDAPLDRRYLVDQWAGAERVELWACQSGVNAPLDPRNPVVDEAFGFDFEFLRVGVRSAIGTLWKVPDFVTACLVHRFRSELLKGRDASEALVAAQRWWVEEGLASLGGHVQGTSWAEGCRRFLSSMGAELSAEDLKDMSFYPESTSRTGPVSDMALEQTLTRLASPLTWAGFRFVGIPERRPLAPWTPAHAAPPSEDVRREVARLLSTLEEPVDDSADPPRRLETALKEARRASAESPSSPAEALALARAYSTRQLSGHADNLLLALAWLHHALAGLPPDARPRKGLSTEAAHLWLDLAARDLPGGRFSALHPPSHMALRQAEWLLEADVPSTGPVHASHVAARLRLRVLREVGAARKKPELETIIPHAWAGMSPLLGDIPERDPSVESLRALLTACEVLLLDVRVLPKEGRQLSRRCATLLQSTQPRPFADIHRAPFLARLWEASGLLAKALGLSTEGPIDALKWLPNHELARSAVQRAFPRPAEDIEDLERFWGNVLSQMEGTLWGEPSDNRSSLIASTGSPCFAYRWTLAVYLRQTCFQGRPQDPIQFITAVQLACDLRLGFFHQLARSSTTAGQSASHGQLWTILRRREALLDSLRDAANAEAGTPEQPLASWSAAMPMAREIEALGDQAHPLWMEIAPNLPVERNARSKRHPLLELHSKVESLEQRLEQLPSGRGLLSVLPGPDFSLYACAFWHDKRGRRGHVVQQPMPALCVQWARMLHSGLDETHPRGDSTARQAHWEELEKLLGPFLESLLRPAIGEPLHWAILAPGALRSLPWLGLSLGETNRFHQCAASIKHLPFLGFDDPLSPPGEPRRAKRPERIWTVHDPRERLPAGRTEVELWEATENERDVHRARFDDTDRIPGLAGDFLACGARSVLDLAWPVHDVVKTLVREHYGRARGERHEGPEALCLALTQTRTLLRHWAKDARRTRSLRDAFALLDEQRAAHSRAKRFTPLTPGGDSVEALVKELLHPSQLAAFRWWGC